MAHRTVGQSVAAVTDDLGTVLRREEFTPFGKSKARSQAASVGPTGGWEEGFHGIRADELMLAGGRAYDSERGSWLSRDPLAMGSPGAVLNDVRLGARYGFNNGNPYAFRDPSGRCPDCKGSISFPFIDVNYEVKTYHGPDGRTYGYGDVDVKAEATGLKVDFFVAIKTGSHTEEFDFFGVKLFLESALDFGLSSSTEMNAALSGIKPQSIDHWAPGYVKPATAPDFDEILDRGLGLQTSGPPSGSSGGPRSGQRFTPAGKKAIDERNAAANGGVNKCDNCGVTTTPGTVRTGGSKVAPTERQRDHIAPRSKGGDGVPANGQILCERCNQAKRDKVP